MDRQKYILCWFTLPYIYIYSLYQYYHYEEHKNRHLKCKIPHRISRFARLVPSNRNAATKWENTRITCICVTWVPVDCRNPKEVKRVVCPETSALESSDGGSENHCYYDVIMTQPRVEPTSDFLESCCGALATTTPLRTLTANPPSTTSLPWPNCSCLSSKAL